VRERHHWTVPDGAREQSAIDPQGNHSVSETMLGQRVGPPLAQQ